MGRNLIAHDPRAKRWHHSTSNQVKREGPGGSRPAGSAGARHRGIAVRHRLRDATQPAHPRPARPISMIVQVEVSGTGVMVRRPRLEY